MLNNFPFDLFHLSFDNLFPEILQNFQERNPRNLGYNPILDLLRMNSTGHISKDTQNWVVSYTVHRLLIKINCIVKGGFLSNLYCMTVVI